MNKINKNFGYLCLACASFFNTIDIYAADIGHYQGSPYATWEGLYQEGLHVRTFIQEAKDGEPILRRFLMYIPQTIYQRQTDYPLVIVAHGGNSTAEQLRHFDLGDRLEHLADEEEFILVYANAYASDGTPAPFVNDEPFNANQGYWRTCAGPNGNFDNFYNVDDTDYLRQVITQLQYESLPVDSDRIYVWGLSNGGEMALQAAREMGSDLAGVGAIVPIPNMPSDTAFGNCDVGTQDPTSVMIMYAPEDPVLDPIFTSIGLDYGDIMEQSFSAWINALGIDSNTQSTFEYPNIAFEGAGYAGTHVPATSTVNSRIMQTLFDSAANGASFSVMTLTPNGGHSWPSFEETDASTIEFHPFGFRNNDIEAEREFWEFFKDKRRIQ